MRRKSRLEKKYFQPSLRLCSTLATCQIVRTSLLRSCLSFDVVGVCPSMSSRGVSVPLCPHEPLLYLDYFDSRFRETISGTVYLRAALWRPQSQKYLQSISLFSEPDAIWTSSFWQLWLPSPLPTMVTRGSRVHRRDSFWLVFSPYSGMMAFLGYGCSELLSAQIT